MDITCKMPDIGDSPWDYPMYTAAEAARFVGLSSGRVRRWIKGYSYKYEKSENVFEVKHQKPVIKRSAPPDSCYASFVDLIDLLFVKRFLNYGLSLQKVRAALVEATKILGTNHFARESFFTDGRNIYLEVKDSGDAILELLSGGQWVISSVIRQLSHQIDFDQPCGVARRWYPLGKDGLIVLDPAISFGRPIIKKKNITTLNVYDFFKGENEDINRVSKWMNISEREVKAAIQFEQQLAA